jgi:hypothetical protein
VAQGCQGSLIKELVALKNFTDLKLTSIQLTSIQVTGASLKDLTPLRRLNTLNTSRS